MTAPATHSAVPARNSHSLVFSSIAASNVAAQVLPASDLKQKRAKVTLSNTGTSTAYLTKAAGDAATSGFPLLAGKSYEITDPAAFYVRCANTDTTTIAVAQGAGITVIQA